MGDDKYTGIWGGGLRVSNFLRFENIPSASHICFFHIHIHVDIYMYII